MNLTSHSSPIKIFNTLSHKEESLTALDPNHLTMYVCGPTVYNRPHLGNARSLVVYDLWFRLFNKIFSRVTYVRNITDVDDKINAAAKEQKISIQNLTQSTIELFYKDTKELNILSPTFEPKATENIPEMIEMIQQLIENGFAYESQKHILFDVAAYKDYGQLSNRTLDEMIAGSRVEIADYKRNPLDFVLWKPQNQGDDASSVFESPWGKGRPGWHIECSAMSKKYLGVDFDIHGGGADLQFPHHENEIAQTRCANKGAKFARYWIHNGFLTSNGEKMSKSLKNFVTVRDLLDQGVSGIVIRYLLISTHYRKPFDYNQKVLDDAKKAIEKFYAIFSAEFFSENKSQITDSKTSNSTYTKQVIEYLADDLNVSKVIAFLHEIIKEIKLNNNQKEKIEFAQTLDFLGLLDVDFFTKKSDTSKIDEAHINAQIELRIKAKQEKDFAKADEIRKTLAAQGIVLEDVAKDKTLWKII